MRISKRDVLIILISLILSAGVSFLINYWLLPPIVVEFDLKGTVALFTSELAQNQSLSSDQKASLSKNFPKVMETAVTQYAKANHAIVLVSPAVMSGAKDVTPDISKLIQIDLSAGGTP